MISPRSIGFDVQSNQLNTSSYSVRVLFEQLCSCAAAGLHVVVLLKRCMGAELFGGALWTDAAPECKHTGAELSHSFPAAARVLL